MTNWKNVRITLAVAAVAIMSVLVLSSWNIENAYGSWNDFGSGVTDTVPKKSTKEKKIRDLDDVIDELNSVEWKVDMEKMQRELKESLKGFDAQKLQLDIEKAIRDVDFQKIQKELEQSMAKIDLANI